MQIFVNTTGMRTSGGKTTKLLVKPSDTIRRVKEEIEKNEGCPPEQQAVLYEGFQRDDDRSFRECGIRRRSVVDIVVTPQQRRQILLLTPKGEKVELDLEPTDTLESLRKQIQEKEGTPSEDVRLQIMFLQPGRGKNKIFRLKQEPEQLPDEPEERLKKGTVSGYAFKILGIFCFNNFQGGNNNDQYGL